MVPKAQPILVVEDCASVRKWMGRVLAEEGFAAIESENGAEALAYLSEGGPAAAIVLDLMMAEMNGWEFRRAQQRDPWLADIPVIVVSALEGRPLEGLSAAAVLRKPVDRETLVETVRAVCAQGARFRRQRVSFL